MTRSKFVSALTATSLLAATLSVAPSATAVQFSGEQRNDRSICVSTSTPSETQVTKDYYQDQLDEYLVMQDELRAAYPQFAAHYRNFDMWIEEGDTVLNPRFFDGITALTDLGFTQYEATFFAVRGTSTYRGLQQLAQSGFSLDMEFAPEWSKVQMASYPPSDVPVVPIGADWLLQESSNRSVDAYEELTDGMPIGAFRTTQSTIPKLRDFTAPRIEALAPSRLRYEAVISPTAILRAAQNCHSLYLTGQLPTSGPVPTTTVTPTATVTAQPTTTTVIPSPVTTTAAPITTTVTAPMATVTETPGAVTTTASAPTITVTTTPSPVTSTAIRPTITVTPAPVTTTEGTATVTRPVTTITVTPAPVTTTTVTEAPVTTTVTDAVATVTETPEPVTTTEEAPTVTVTVTPTVTDTVAPDPEPEPDGGGNNFGMVAAIVAVLAAIGGIVAFFANNLGLFAPFI